MTLSNIFREPRREIIEQAFGTVAVVGVATLWFGSAYALMDWFGPTHIVDRVGVTVVCAIGEVIAVALLIGAALLAHDVGEAICGALADAGRDPRPRQRY